MPEPTRPGWLPQNGRRMELAGTIEDNLRAAVKSAQRLRSFPVHRDTLAYWTELLVYAQVEQRRWAPVGNPEIEMWICLLRAELSARERTG